ncbi:LysE family translocator [bacterium]|jgi:threonine/homoserine/homoserine lactone efflux protein|uniref:LysE family translocator n=1 Tax=Pelagibacter ubique TaxID=198252 RepID=UPI00041A4A55|nr:MULTISPECIES: LysE family translocator [Pelagibacter]MDA7444582.1 LysE family translocator [Candidatus Pelagibacter ubique]MDA9135288.1 LysE family translocator [bacterium]MBL6862391.1 LysE family translocator [Candidatus Pelagibacter bacterium]MDA7453639.1 LysE family translocator [Candidatus Pelagibacter ubique]MDA7457660.1 LysE family translocator [Candidatus Pelagibacter ubique]
MHPELFLLIGISCSLGFTPGPNNAVASYSGFNFGIKKTIPLIMGVWLGYTVLVILINFVLISTFIKYPLIQEVIRILGTLFLIYLAYKISFSETSKEGKKINPVKFIDTFTFQFLNPKGVMAAITLISKFVLENDYLNSSLTVIVVCSLTALTSITAWAFLGKFLRNFATNNNFIKRFNYAMSLLLIVCIIGFYI